MMPETIQDKLIVIGSIVLRNSALDLKTKTLIAVATATGCSHCHGQFRATAVKMGITDVQIQEAEKLAMSMRERCVNESGMFLIRRTGVETRTCRTVCSPRRAECMAIGLNDRHDEGSGGRFRRHAMKTIFAAGLRISRGSERRKS